MNTDVAIIGGGFFGLYLAEYLSLNGKSVIVIEKESDAMQRASYVNQARVHNGYHYPRSILTALKSRMSFPRFVDEFKNCIDDEFDKYYLISKQLGKVNKNQFKKFCDRIGAPCSPSMGSINNLVNPKMIEAVFLTKEFAFDSTVLKKTMLDRIQNVNVEILYNHRVESVAYDESSSLLNLSVTSEGECLEISAKQVFNCTYSMTNLILEKSKVDLIPLRHELAEMCIVDVPEELKNTGITVMCGPFFSVMPFPSKGLHTFSHVRYTPHYGWNDAQGSYMDPHEHFAAIEKKSAWKKMKHDAQRYLPILSDLEYKESLWEIKTILPRSDSDDSRPILFKANYAFPGFHCIVGGKIDNVYDVIEIINILGLDR